LVLELSAARRVPFAVSLDGNDVGTPVPSQIRRCDLSPAMLPGADEMLKIGNGPWLFQVLNCAIDPAQEPLPVIDQQVRCRGRPPVRMTHHPFCLANLPFDV
jgi:hypothetical protein